MATTPAARASPVYAFAVSSRCLRSAFHQGLRAGFRHQDPASNDGDTDLKFRFTQLREIAVDEILALHRDAKVLRHLPLATGTFDAEACGRWLADKEAQWDRHGHGPWAIMVDGHFAGWGGLQREGDDADLALVMSPHYWGLGLPICREILRIGFEELGVESVTARLPASRTRTAGLGRMGFRRDGEVSIDGVRFIRFRLSASDRQRVCAWRAGTCRD